MHSRTQLSEVAAPQMDTDLSSCVEIAHNFLSQKAVLHFFLSLFSPSFPSLSLPPFLPSISSSLVEEEFYAVSFLPVSSGALLKTPESRGSGTAPCILCSISFRLCPVQCRCPCGPGHQFWLTWHISSRSGSSWRGWPVLLCLPSVSSSESPCTPPCTFHFL